MDGEALRQILAVSDFLGLARRFAAIEGWISDIEGYVLYRLARDGEGAGANPDSIQVPSLIRQAVRSGIPRHVGEGENIWSTVHVDDVADAYLLALEGARAGSFYYIENGEASLKSIVQSIARLLGGKRTPQSWSIDDAIAEWGPQAAWFSLGGNSRIRADKARKLLSAAGD